MSAQSLLRGGAFTVILTALIWIAAAVAVVVVPNGGLANPIAPILYYAGLILAVPAYLTLYAVQGQAAGKLGFVGFAMAILGSILYSGPAYVLVAGTSGVASWHDVWGFAMSNVLPLGGVLFLLGSTLAGIATLRAGLLPRGAGLILAAGSFLWLVAFILSVIPYLLPVANLLTAAGLLWLGASVLGGAPVKGLQANKAIS